MHVSVYKTFEDCVSRIILLATFDNKIVNKNFNEPYIL